MKKVIILLALMALSFDYSYGKIYATVTSMVVHHCVVYTVTFFEDHNNTDPTDDTIIGVDFVLKCSNNFEDEEEEIYDKGTIKFIDDMRKKEEKSMSIEEFIRYTKGLGIDY